MLPILPPAQTVPATPAPADQAKRLDDAQALLTASMKAGLSYDSKTTYLQAVQHQPGLLKAWGLTEGEAWAPGLVRRRNEIRMELAWQLQDSSKMQAVWTGVEALDGHYDLREAVHAFFISAHLGQWKTTLSIGKILNAKGPALAGLHQMALSNLSSFDYASIFDLIQENPGLPLQWTLEDRSWSIQNKRIRVASAQALVAAYKAQVDLINSLNDRVKAYGGWTPAVNSPISLIQIGAAARWVEGSSSPPVSGFITADHIWLKGSWQDNGPGDTGLQVQTFDLHLVPGSKTHWEGTCRMDVLVPDTSGKQVPAMTSVWDYQWDLIPEPGK